MRLKITLIGFLMLYSLGVSAFSVSDCHSPSPNIKAKRDLHSPVKETRLSKKQYTNLRSMFDDLDGRWEGRSQEYWCDGPEGEKPGLSIVNYNFEAKVEKKNSKEYVLIFTFRNVKDRSHHEEKLTFYLDRYSFRVNDDDDSGNTEIENMSNRNIAFIHNFSRYMQANIRLEYEKTIIQTGSGFEITSKYYRQGLLQTYTVWTFQTKAF